MPGSSRPDAKVQARNKAEGTSTGFLEHLGPGLVTGAADDDPSGIATYSQVGAEFGFAMRWTNALQLSGYGCHAGNLCKIGAYHRGRYHGQLENGLFQVRCLFCRPVIMRGQFL